MIYFILLFYMIFLSYKFDILKKKDNKLLSYWLLLFIFIVLAGLRYRVGSDTIVYMGAFKVVPPIDEIFSVGLKSFVYRPIWMIYFSFFKYLGSFYLLQLSNAIILNCTIFSYARKNVDCKFTFILFYYILFYIGLNFEVMREALAVSVAIWGYKYWIEKKWIKYYFLAFISFNIHDSAIILFILPFIRYITLNIKWGNLILLFLCITCLSLRSYLEVINLWVMNFFGESSISTKFNTYANMRNDYNLNYYLNYWYIPIILIPSFIIYANNKMKMEIKNINLLYLYSFLGVLMTFMSVLGRFSNYLIVFILAFIANFMVQYVHTKSIKIKFVTMLFVIAITIPSVFINYASNFNEVKFYNKYYPYSSIFNEFKDIKRESTANEIEGTFIVK